MALCTLLSACHVYLIYLLNEGGCVILPGSFKSMIALWLKANQHNMKAWFWMGTYQEERWFDESPKLVGQDRLNCQLLHQ